MKGTIVNVQKYSVHDGPGIRTTVFFKGCPLRCWWCHNPETLSPKEEIMQCAEKCTQCGRCISRCSEKAISLKDGNPLVDNERCRVCGKCADLCISEAREHVGRSVGVSELMKHIKKDLPFYEQSGGGVTFSGGEPLMQADFLGEMLARCRESGIDTVVDTCGYAPWSSFEKIVDSVGLFLYDLKIYEDEKHMKYTGVSNKLIIENLRRLSDLGKRIYVRMPIIMGINDDDEHVEGCIGILSELNILQVNLLPYHKFGIDKYHKLSLVKHLTGDEKPSDERIEEIAQRFSEAGINVKVGG